MTDFSETGIYLAYLDQGRIFRVNTNAPEHINPKNKRGGSVKQITRILAGIALGCHMAGNAAHASIIESMTIEEIGIASGGLGTSALSSAGGEFFAAGVPADSGFVSAGSLDGAIIMGQAQGVNAFTPGFTFFSGPALPHTSNGAPSGSITGGTMALDLSGWGTWWNGIDYVLFPDAGTLLTSVSRLDASHFYYTADWSHVMTSGPFPGISTTWHLEGIATVPEPGTLWLLGASALGLMVLHRRKHP